MNSKSLSLAFLLSVSVLAACSGGGNDNSATYDVTADVSVPVGKTADNKKSVESAPQQALYSNKDADTSSEPYKLGRDHAAKLHSRCTTESEVRDELLDVNARIYSIRCHIGEDAANDYVQGFKSYLAEVGDTLAAVF